MFLSPLSCHHCTAYAVCYCQARQRALLHSDLVQQVPVISTPHCYWPLMWWSKAERCKCSITTKTLSQALQVFSSKGQWDCQTPARAHLFWGAVGSSLAWHRCANPLMHWKCNGTENVLLNQDSKCMKDLYHVISTIYFKVKYKDIFPTSLICNTDK